jgi:hypothetical protein
MATLDEEFEASFRELTKGGEEKTAATLAAEKTDADKAIADAAAKAIEDQPIDDATKAAEAAAAAAAAVVAPVVDPAAAAVETPVVPLTEEEIAEKAAADAVKATEAARAADDERLARFAEQIAEKGKPAARAAVETTPAPFSADELGTITAYEKDWPDVFKAQGIIARAQTQQVVGYMLQEFAKVIAPMQAQIEALSGRQTEVDLAAAIPDYDKVYGQVTQWVDKQPDYLKVALKGVIDHGTPDQVTDLVGRWRKDTGNTAAQPTALVPPVKKDTELSPAAKKAAAALAPVGSKRTVVVADAGADDFDGAFAEYAKALEPA